MKQLGFLCRWLQYLSMVFEWHELARLPYKNHKRLAELESEMGACMMAMNYQAWNKYIKAP